MKPQLLILIGPPASGKSTFAKQYIAQERERFLKLNEPYNSTVIVSRDSIREAISDTYHLNDEVFVDKIHSSIIYTALNENRNVILDSTNCDINKLKALINKFKVVFNIELKFMEEFSLKELIRRENDRNRSFVVPEKVIEKFYGKFLKCYHKKDELENLTILIDTDNVTETTIKFNAIIVDIDGTVALNTSGRSFMDSEAVINDTPNIEVCELINNLSRSKYEKLIFLSGRTEKSRTHTIEWLSRYFKDFSLFMRANGDYRTDAIVKYELYKTHVENTHNVLLWIDDRDQVVQMVRNSLNITCLQVNYGNF